MIDLRTSMSVRLGFVGLALFGMIVTIALVVVVARDTEEQIAVRLAQAEMKNMSAKLVDLTPKQKIDEIASLVSSRHLASQIARGASLQSAASGEQLDHLACATPERDRRIIAAAFSPGHLPGEPQTTVAGTIINWDSINANVTTPQKVQIPTGAACNGSPAIAQVVVTKVGPTVIVVGWMTQPLLEIARRHWVQALLAIGLALLIGICVALLMERRSNAQMRYLTSILGEIGRGNFTAHPDGPYQSSAQVGEYRQLSIAISTMAQQLKGLHDGLNSLMDRTAHDLRTPLARAIARIDAVIFKETDPEGVKELKIVEAELRDLSNRFGAMLALRHAANLDPNLGDPVDLAEIARLAGDLYQDLDIGQNKTVTLNLQPVWVHGQRGLLQNAVANLLDNALRFSPEGSVVEISTTTQGPSAILVISDCGPGLAAHVIETVFEAGVTSRAAEGGYGLGLTTVREVAHKYNGSITLTPRVGNRGLDARLILPSIPSPISS